MVGLFSARGYNIDSLSVSTTEDTTMSRMTIVTCGSDDVIEQITKQLNKLIEVIKVVDLTDGNHARARADAGEVRAAGKDRDEMKRMADIFRGRILDVTDKELHGGAHRRQRQTRRIHRRHRARRDSGNGTHRCFGNRAWRTDPEI